MACAPCKDSDQTGHQPGHPPSLIGVFAVHMKKVWVPSYPLSAQRRLWSDWADAQADLSLRWAHVPLCWFCHEAADRMNLPEIAPCSLPQDLIWAELSATVSIGPSICSMFELTCDSSNIGCQNSECLKNEIFHWAHTVHWCLQARWKAINMLKLQKI